MFERYTEKARRVIFFARYEASQLGTPAIEPEHLLLGLLREDKTLTSHFFSRVPGATLDTVREEIKSRLPPGEAISTSVELPLSQSAKRALAYAHEESERLQHRHIGTEHLLLGLLREETSMAAELLHRRGLRLDSVRAEVARASGTHADESSHTLPDFLRDLTEEAARNHLSPVVGRDEAINQIIYALSRRDPVVPVLVGLPGIGKTAVAHGLAQRIHAREVPAHLAGARLLALDPTEALARASSPESFAALLQSVIASLEAARGEPLLFIDNLHLLIGEGTQEARARGAARVLLSALSRGHLRLLAAAPTNEYRIYVETDEALGRYLRAVELEELPFEDALDVLRAHKERYEVYHKLLITDAALVAAATHARRHPKGLPLPASALDLLDETAARARVHAEANAEVRQEIDEQDVTDTAASWTRADTREQD
ncbi:MAG TPA: Clp protease N-terminal domain-containing protein [Pyrinomonadaceae bacterium]|nr:Clp protease N-terminal domain-containing protein [Pyrinomonadaceae bacterium]